MTITKEFKILCICVSVILLVFLLPVPVLAENNYSFIPVDASYNSVSLTSVTAESQYTYCYFTTNNDIAYYGNIYRDTTYSTNSNDLYYCLIRSGSNSYNLMLAVEGNISSDDGQNIVRISTSSSGSQGYNIQYSNRTYNSVFNLSWNKSNSTITCLPYCNVYDTTDDALNALRTAINNGTAGGVPDVDYGPARLYIKPGTVAYISVSGGHVELYVDIGRYFRGEYYSNQRWATASNLPSNSSSLSFNPTWGTRIVYTAAGDRNILGQSQAGVADLPGGTDPLSVGYVVIYNPVYDQGGDLNPTIRVDVDDFIAVAQYPLTSSVDNGIVVATGNVDEVYSATSDDVNEGGTFDYIYSYTDSNGNTITSSAITTPTGGNTVITESDENTISGILESILDIFRAPITHIQNLFNAGANFFAWIANLWTWLPAPVIGVLTSALVVLIAIGVIKFLWK